jgi:hypothetical protein
MIHIAIGSLVGLMLASLGGLIALAVMRAADEPMSPALANRPPA